MTKNKLWKWKLTYLLLTTLICSQTILADSGKLSEQVTMIEGVIPKKISPSTNYYNFELPRNIFTQIDKQRVLIQQSNGYGLTEISKDQKIRKISDNIYSYFGEYPQENADETALSSQNFVYSNPINHTIEAITPEHKRILIAGKAPKNKEEADEQTYSLMADLQENLALEKSVPLSQATFVLPLGIIELPNFGWVVLNQGGNDVQLISLDKRIKSLKIDHQEAFKGLKASENGIFWLFGETTVVEYDLKTQVILRQWDNQKNQQFKEISDLAITPQGTFITDQGDSSIKKLNENNTTSILYQSSCNDLYLENHDYECNPTSKNSHQILRFKPQYLSQNLWGDGILVVGNEAIYTLSFDGQLNFFAGHIDETLNQTDQELDAFMRTCSNIFVDQKDIYCSNLTELNVFKNGLPPRQKYIGMTIAEFAVKNNTFFGTIKDTISRHSIKPSLKKGDSYQWVGRDSERGFKDGKTNQVLWGENISSMIMDNEGNIFVADQSNYRIRKIDILGNVTTVIHFLEPKPTNPNLTENEALATEKYNGQPVLIGSNTKKTFVVDFNSNIYEVDLKQKSYKMIYKNTNENIGRFNSLAVDSNHNIWLSTQESNLKIFRFHHNHLENLTDKLLNIGVPDDTNIYAIKFDEQGNLLLGTSRGLIKLDKSAVTE